MIVPRPQDYIVPSDLWPLWWLLFVREIDKTAIKMSRDPLQAQLSRYIYFLDGLIRIMYRLLFIDYEAVVAVNFTTNFTDFTYQLCFCFLIWATVVDTFRSRIKKHFVKFFKGNLHLLHIYKSSYCKSSIKYFFYFQIVHTSFYSLL